MTQLRLAEKSELEWINSRYEQVSFFPSTYEKEKIAIAEVAGEKAGLGRLVTLNGKSLELGGMFVFEAFRGQGVAREIVQFLLSFVQPSQTVYCIPFEHLCTFYQQSGFVPCTNFETVPKELLDKYFWCKANYPQPTQLLERK